ncbi:MAG: GMC family oxidoreductase N-terminal domain-containing protein [Pseudonocardiaceae bacterium]
MRTLPVTAAREVEEETGWRPRGMTLLTRFQPVVGSADLENLIFLGEGAGDTKRPADINEAARIEWIMAELAGPTWQDEGIGLPDEHDDSRVGRECGVRVVCWRYDMDVFDYVVVGGGSVVAARLSQDRDARVLLLEAGAAQPLEAMSVPAAWPTLRGSSADWANMTTPQSELQKAVAWPRGRALGGSSSINAMMFARGHRSSYDAWEVAGGKGWGFEGLLPCFQRSEHAEGRDPGLRGMDGPMVVAPAATPHPVTAAAIEAAVEAGHAHAVDISGGLEEGFGWVDLNILDGARQSAADAYLRPVLDRANLSVVTETHVGRLRVEGDRCTGVDYTVGGESLRVGCSREVVLCAGTIGSAQLMLLSGIGPADQLREVGVEVVTDLPGVGANLHDHPLVRTAYTATRPVAMGADNHVEAIGLMRSDPSLSAPDLQAHFVVPGPAELGDGFLIQFALMTPHSRGHLWLASADPSAAPLLDPRYLSDSRDLDALVAGLELVREIGRAPALAPWRDQEVSPGADIQDDDSLRGFLRAKLESYSHYAGSCRMGSDDMAVVDTDLRVRGIDGLRIADASVMPSIPSANTHATVLAIAERASELIRSSGPYAA